MSVGNSIRGRADRSDPSYHRRNARSLMGSDSMPVDYVLGSVRARTLRVIQ